MSRPVLGVNLDLFMSAAPRDDLFESWRRAADVVAELGFAGVMICWPEEHAVQGRRAFPGILAQSGLALLQFHGPFGPQAVALASPDSAKRAQTLEIFRRWLGYAAEMDAGEMVIHPTLEIPLEDSLDDGVRRSADVLCQALEDAPPELLLAVENVAGEERPDQQLFGAVPTLLAEIVERTGDQRVKVCLDTSHCAAHWIRPEQALKEVSECLGSIHIHDTPRYGTAEHRLPGDGVLDWPAFFRELRQTGFAGPLLYELTMEEDLDARKQRLAENKACVESML